MPAAPPLLALVLLLAGAQGAPPQRVVLNQSGSGLIDRSVVVPLDLLTRASAEQMARDFLKANEGKFKMLRLVIGVEERSVIAHAAGKAVHDLGYGGGRHSYEHELKALKLGPLAELIAFGGSAVLRWRGSGEEFDRVVLHGRDPLLIRIGHCRFEILHFASSAPVDYMRDPPEESFSLHFHVRTADRLTARRVRALTRYLIRKVGLKQLGTSVRHDPWFLDNAYYPGVYRFERLGPVPSYEQYRAAAFVHCGYTRGEIRCFGPEDPP